MTAHAVESVCFTTASRVLGLDRFSPSPPQRSRIRRIPQRFLPRGRAARAEHYQRARSGNSLLCVGSLNYSCGSGPRYNIEVQRKIFWTVFIVLGVVADVTLPLIWGLLATIPIAIVSWWVAYRTDWF